MTETKLRAADAQSLLDNPVFNGALEAVEDKLQANIANVDPDNKDQCARVVLAVQILKGIEREVRRYVTDGEVENLVELESRRQLSITERVSGVLTR